MSTDDDRLTDDALLATNIFFLSAEQMRRRHRLLQERFPIAGALQRLTPKQAKSLVASIRKHHPEFIKDLASAGVAYRRDRDANAYSTVIYRVLNQIAEYAGTVGFDRMRFTLFGEAQTMIWKEAKLDDIE